MKKIYVLSTLLLALIVSCGDFSTEPDWAKYDSGLKSRIDNANCEGLQKEFNTENFTKQPISETHTNDIDIDQEAVYDNYVQNAEKEKNLEEYTSASDIENIIGQDKKEAQDYPNQI